jgi:CCR4-NOT transcription complex subunit 9
MSDEMNKDNSIDEIKNNNTTSQEDISTIIQWVNDIKNENLRENALSELSKKRETFADLAIYIWYSSSTVSVLYICII